MLLLCSWALIILCSWALIILCSWALILLCNWVLTLSCLRISDIISVSYFHLSSIVSISAFFFHHPFLVFILHFRASQIPRVYFSVHASSVVYIFALIAPYIKLYWSCFLIFPSYRVVLCCISLVILTSHVASLVCAVIPCCVPRMCTYPMLRPSYVQSSHVASPLCAAIPCCLCGAIPCCVPFVCGHTLLLSIKISPSRSSPHETKPWPPPLFWETLYHPRDSLLWMKLNARNLASCSVCCVGGKVWSALAAKSKQNSVLEYPQPSLQSARPKLKYA